MISIDKEDYAILMGILKKYPLKVYVYGSRSKNSNDTFSDLDLCIFDEKSDRSDIFNLKEELKESNLSCTVDVGIWSLMDKNFQKLIKPDLVLIHDKKKHSNISRNL